MLGLTTVTLRVEHIITKLAVADRTQAAVKAVKRRLSPSWIWILSLNLRRSVSQPLAHPAQIHTSVRTAEGELQY